MCDIIKRCPPYRMVGRMRGSLHGCQSYNNQLYTYRVDHRRCQVLATDVHGERVLLVAPRHPHGHRSYSRSTALAVWPRGPLRVHCSCNGLRIDVFVDVFRKAAIRKLGGRAREYHTHPPRLPGLFIGNHAAFQQPGAYSNGDQRAGSATRWLGVFRNSPVSAREGRPGNLKNCLSTGPATGPTNPHPEVP